MTHPSVQVQPNSQITDIPLTERQRLTDDNLSTSLRFFNLPLGIGPNDRGLPHLVVVRATMYLPVPGIDPRPLCSKASMLPTRPQWQKLQEKSKFIHFYTFWTCVFILLHIFNVFIAH